MDKVEVIHGDSLVELPKLKARGVACDACVCDPPYFLASITKRFGGENAAPAQFGTDGAYARASRGFMNSRWDTDIALRQDIWRACFDLMKPGAYLVAFSSTRTFGRMQVAIEDAGFITHPMVVNLFGSDSRFQAWWDSLNEAQQDGFLRLLEQRDAVAGMLLFCFGTGFPKATRLKCDGVEGYRYGAQALKPALEPIYMGQKPMEGTGTENWLKHGVGALNIDAARIDCAAGDKGEWPITERRHDDKTWTVQPVATDQSKGRWPANLVHDGSDEVLAAFAQYGESTGKATAGRNGRDGGSVFPLARQRDDVRGHTDSGTAARFFFSGKASKDDRMGTGHPTTKPTELIRWLTRLVCPPGGLVLDPFGGSGTTAVACLREGFRCIIVEKESEYVEMIRQRLKHLDGADTPLFADPPKAQPGLF